MFVIIPHCVDIVLIILGWSKGWSLPQIIALTNGGWALTLRVKHLRGQRFVYHGVLKLASVQTLGWHTFPYCGIQKPENFLPLTNIFELKSCELMMVFQ